MEQTLDFPPVYLAELWLSTTVHWSPNLSFADVWVKGKLLRVKVVPELRKQARQDIALHQANATWSAKLWFRSKPNAKLRPNQTQLRLLKPEPQPERFRVQGRVLAFDANQGLLHVGIYPNSKGALLHPFALTLQMPTELAQNHQALLSPGQSVRALGVVNPERHLEVQHMEAIDLPIPKQDELTPRLRLFSGLPGNPALPLREGE